MLQLVGQKCLICQQKLESILEGRFCEQCGCPIHNTCSERPREQRAPDSCEQCGTPRQIAVEHRAQWEKTHARHDTEVRVSLGLRNIGLGLVWILGGTLASLFCTALTIGGGRYVVATGAVFVGLAQIIFGIRQVAGRGQRR
jgi:hypothetical protein